MESPLNISTTPEVYKITVKYRTNPEMPLIHEGIIPSGDEHPALRALYNQYGDKSYDNKYQALAKWCGSADLIEDEASYWTDEDDEVEISLGDATYTIEIQKST